MSPLVSFEPFHRSARPSNGLASHCHDRIASARSSIISPLVSFEPFHRSARPSNGLASHCHDRIASARSSIISPLASSIASPRLALPWNISVFARRILAALGGDHGEGGGQACPRVPRQDHLVHVAALGGDVGIGELLPVLPRLGVLERARIGGGVHLATVKD